VQKFAERNRVRVRFDAAAGAEDLNSEQKTVVFRVAQESLTNVARHAQASRVQIFLRANNGSLQMQIKDNGKSFPVDQQLGVNGKKRLGLVGMQERVRLVNGRFAITSAPGKGTSVRVEIPFTPDKEKMTYAKNKRATG
jgi:signal transduction histidine kinase